MHHITPSTPAFVLSECQQCFGHLKNKCSLASHIVNGVCMCVSDCMKQNFILIIIRQRINMFFAYLCNWLTSVFWCDFLIVTDVANYLKSSCVYTSWVVPAIYGKAVLVSIGLVLLREGSEGWHICGLPLGFRCCIAHWKPCTLQQNTEFKFQITMLGHDK